MLTGWGARHAERLPGDRDHIVALNAAVATGNDVGIFGDLKRYRVFERVGLQVKRLEELRALTDEVGFRFRFRTGGDVMLNKAFRSIRVL